MRDMAQERMPQMIETAVVIGRGDDTFGARTTESGEAGKGGGNILRGHERTAQEPGILEGHVRPLGEEGQGRMGGVANENEPTAGPSAGHGVAEQPPKMHIGHMLDPELHGGAPAAEGHGQRNRIVRLVPALGHPFVAFLDGHDIDETTAPQGIADHVPPRPHEHMGFGRMFAHAAHERPPGDLAGEARRKISLDKAARIGANPVGPYHEIGFHAAPVRQRHLRPLSLRGDADHLGVGLDLDPRRPDRSMKQGHEIGPMHQQPGMGVGKSLSDRQTHHRAAREPVMEHHPAGGHAHFPRFLREAERREHGTAIGRDLETGTDLADDGAPLVQPHMGSGLSESRGGGQPANTAACNDHPQTIKFHVASAPGPPARGATFAVIR